MPLEEQDRESGTLATLPPAEQSFEQKRKELSRQIVLVLNRAGETLGEYKPAIIAIGLVLLAMPFLAFIVALLAVINALPLLAPTFKLIGFGFTAWFVYRYLLFAPNRQELSQEVENLKGQVLGPKNESLKSTVESSDE